jgi:hypothetical protein
VFMVEHPVTESLKENLLLVRMEFPLGPPPANSLEAIRIRLFLTNKSGVLIGV